MKHLNRFLVILGFLIVLSVRSSAFGNEQAETSHIKATLVSESSTFTPGKDFMVGIHFIIDKGWHLYWLNPGDSGLPPSVTWHLPKGFKAGDLVWPLPTRLPLPSLMDYGYQDQLLLMAPIHVSKNVQAGSPVTLKADVKWLVCREECIPGKGTIRLTLPAQAVDKATQTLFEQTRKDQPKKLPKGWKALGALDQDGFKLTFQAPGAQVRTALFFPADPNVIDNTADQKFSAGRGSFELGLKKSDQLMKAPDSMKGLLVLSGEGYDGKVGYWVDVPLTGKP
jgi:thiol:disulfide interchange protein DsbD